MNLESERNKPLFVTRRHSLTALHSAARLVNEAVGEGTALYASQGDFMLKAAAARKLPNTVLVRIDESLQHEAKDLVLNRFEADPGETFRFLDGRTFTGSEAAREIRLNTQVGNYFLELEKETIRIAQEAYLAGELR